MRRAKLYYLRNLRGKSARIVEKKQDRPAGRRCRRRRVISFTDPKFESAAFGSRFFVAAALRAGRRGGTMSVWRDVLYGWNVSRSLHAPASRASVLDDRSRLPWRFFGRLTTAALIS